MEVIITHDVTDFDALASAVAAQKVYPGARILLGSRHGRDVRDYLALHRDRFVTWPAASLDASAVRRAILVDVRRASRLGHVSALTERMLARDPLLEVHVWDHHAATDEDVPAAFDRSEPVGSATTLLVEEMQRRELGVDPGEATVPAIGDHVDTGAPAFTRRLYRARAVLTWLMERGARLSVINRYCHQPFTAGQTNALRAVLAALRVERIGGARIGFAVVSEGAAVSGLDEVTSETLAIEDVHAVIALFALRGGRVQVVARSRAPWIDVGSLMRRMGGGGHGTAGAAVIRDSNPAAVAEQLREALQAQPPRAARVRDLMSSPVHTLSPEASIAELNASLGRWQHSGAPVVAAGKLVGIVSRRDLERAQARAGAQSRVAQYMSRPVLTTEEHALLEDVLERMVHADIGRLPVLREDRVVGIITRRDILSQLYGAEA